MALLLASLAYCYFLSSYMPKGLSRVISIFPTFYIFYMFPWCFPSSLLRGVLSFFITWITSFKLLLFCFDQSPLFACQNYIDFMLISVFPIIMKENPSRALKLRPKLLVGSLTLLVIIYLHMHKDKKNQELIFITLGLFFLFIYGANLDRYEPLEIFKKPYLATSLQDFWGRRWNRLSSNILRQTIYNPTQNCLKGIVGIRASKVLALITALIVSGVMHELMFYYITCGKKPTWEVSKFFVLQGVFMVFEGGLKNLGRIKRWKGLNLVARNVLTVGFVLITSYLWLVLPVWRSGQNECSLKSKGLDFEVLRFM